MSRQSWLRTVEADLKPLNCDLHTACQRGADRSAWAWRSVVETAMLLDRRATPWRRRWWWWCRVVPFPILPCRIQNSSGMLAVNSQCIQWPTDIRIFLHPTGLARTPPCSLIHAPLLLLLLLLLLTSEGWEDDKVQLGAFSDQRQGSKTPRRPSARLLVMHLLCVWRWCTVVRYPWVKQVHGTWISVSCRFFLGFSECVCCKLLSVIRDKYKKPCQF